MATLTSIPALIYTAKPCSTQCRKTRFNPITSSSSNPRSFAIKCNINTNDNASGVMDGLQSSWIYKSMDSKDLDNFKSGITDELRNTKGLDDIVWGVVKEVLPKPECRGFVEGLANAREKVDAAERQFQHKEDEIKKMKQRVDQLQIRAAKIEKCHKRLREVRALVEEAERSLQLVMNGLEH